MAQKFKNMGKGDIGFGNGLTVRAGEAIELDDKLLEQKKQAIELLVKSGALERATGASLKEKPKEEEPKEKPQEKPAKKEKGE